MFPNSTDLVFRGPVNPKLLVVSWPGPLCEGVPSSDGSPAASPAGDVGGPAKSSPMVHT